MPCSKAKSTYYITTGKVVINDSIITKPGKQLNIYSALNGIYALKLLRFIVS
jgi:hypothetical protein